MSDLDNAIKAGLYLYVASRRQITAEELSIMLAICGRESSWDFSAVQNNGVGDPRFIGWGYWQITPGDGSLLIPSNNAEAAWELMIRGEIFENNPYGAWNLQRDGQTLIFQTGTEPNGTTIQEHPPSLYEYNIGRQAANSINLTITGGNMIFIENNNIIYWFIPAGIDSYWRPMPKNVNPLIPPALIIPDPNGVLLSLWKVGSGVPNT